MIYGIDVSSYQAEHYPTKANGHDVSFVFIKATEGTSYTNPKMNHQAEWARSHGHVVGFYHYVKAGNMKAQAAYFVKQASSVEGDILALDWEETSVSGAQKDAFLHELKRLRPTHKVMLYCSQSFWTGHDKTSYAADGLWIAQYNGAPGKPSIKADWLIHQYTSNVIDTNVAQFASKAAMKEWASPKTTPPAKTPETPKAPSAETTTVIPGQYYFEAYRTTAAPLTVLDTWYDITLTGETADDGQLFTPGASGWGAYGGGQGVVWLEVSGVPEGDEIQVRLSEKNSTGGQVKAFPIVEGVGTSGSTFFAYPFAGLLASGHTLTLQVKNSTSSTAVVLETVRVAGVWWRS